MVAPLLAALALIFPSGNAEAWRFLPDPAFGTKGVVNLLAGNGAGGVFRAVGGVEPGPEGTVYVLYRDLPAPGTYECEVQRHLVRYLPNGRLDDSFGDGGMVPIHTPLGCQYPSLAVEERLRPLLIWNSVGTLRAPSSTLAMTRFTSDGVLDPSFGSGGVALLQIPCPGGNGAGAHSDRRGRLILEFGCLEPESAEGLPGSSFHFYLAGVQPNGALDTGFGDGGFVALPSEAGWEPPWVAAVERNGALILSQWTRYTAGIPQQTRLLRVRPDGTLDTAYQAQVERSLRRVARLGAPRVPEEATDFVLRPKGGLAVGGRASRGGWVIALRHNGSLDRQFSHDGYRRFATPIRYVAADRRGRLFVLGLEYRGLTIYRLLPDGNRDRSVGGPAGQWIGGRYLSSLADLVSLRHGRPLLYLTNLGGCSTPVDCPEPAGELRRLRLVTKGR